MRDGDALFPRDAVALLAAFTLDTDARARGRGQPIRADIVNAAATLRLKAIEASLAIVSDHGHNGSQVPRSSASFSTSRDIAKDAGCTPRTVVRAIHRGELPAHLVNRHWIITDIAAAARWAAERNHR